MGLEVDVVSVEDVVELAVGAGIENSQFSSPSDILLNHDMVA